MGNPTPVRLALFGNALFSTVSAGFLIFSPSLVGDWLGFHSPAIFMVIGIALAIFAVELIYQATRKRLIAWRALAASCSDFLWVFASIVLLVFRPVAFSLTGILVVAAVASVVFIFGSLQLWGLSYAYKLRGKDSYRLCAAIAVNAPSTSMWRVISSLGDIQKYSSGLKESTILNEETPGVGVVRMCSDHKGKRWAEECTDFRVGHGYAVRFQTEAPEFPFPVSHMTGGWEVTSKGEGSEIRIWFELKPKPAFLAPVILSLLAYQLDNSFPEVIQNMANDTCDSLHPTTKHKQGIVARLLPQAC